MLKLDKGLQEFLKEAIEEKSICTVEGSFRRQLTLEEEKHLNAALHPFGHAVHKQVATQETRYFNAERNG